MCALMNSTPALSVLLPVRNAAAWLPAALGSLWRQSERDFEVIAVDDGSQDGSAEILTRAARRESRLRVHVRAPAGLPETLRFASEHANTGLLARQDADDVSHHERFARQRAFLASHPEVAVVGCRVRLFPTASVGAGMRRWNAWHDALLSHDSMHAERLIDVPMLNGAAMLRREAVLAAGGWQERGWAEDLDLWLRLFAMGARFAKLPQRLYSWRQHPSSSTRSDSRYSHDRFLALKVDALGRDFLPAGRKATLIGVGESLERWRSALGPQRLHRVCEARRPDPQIFRVHTAPFVLVFVSPAARDRWRAAAQISDLCESSDFTFVA